ncbi:5-formyltetrahydrofolate cyclo-ligase [Leuconostoc pseudomesenteroides]|uniref:5-formyltetrahydrofolate cyclo-ligase n=1 Tax=Leuconostoc pseudomesenteroides TaxID=33968 RepID=UPI002285A266|nr:5-formyltetrahydrofolate cyclo-ligase [Leuconostoc pseudomesenteroides]WAM38246.1 5-formyltetrahydrofolate cyclo-ligase [Leuconostoc pseudomesenteroides]
MLSEKQEIRTYILENLSSYKPDDKLKHETRLYTQLFNCQLWQDASTVAVTMSMENELNTQPIIDMAINVGKKVFIPRVSKKDLLWFDYSKNRLSKSNFGILEPNQEVKFAHSLNEIDLMIVPGVAFTPDNYRVGYGAGFFDRVLSKYSKDTISLVLPPQLIDNFSRNQWDMPVKNMLT